jgi:hypothetical protein
MTTDSQLAFKKDRSTGMRTARVAVSHERRYEIKKHRGGVLAEVFKGDRIVSATRVKTFKAAEAWCERDLAIERR